MTKPQHGRHGGSRRPLPWTVWLLFSGLIVLALLGALVAVAAPWEGTTEGGTATTCTEPTARISADPKIARVVTQATRDLDQWLEPEECLVVEVRAVESHEVAAQLTRPAGTGFAAPLPDIWIADSSVWLVAAAATDIGRLRLRGEPTSVASSPVVVAMPADGAQTSAWPRQQPRWAGLLADPDGRIAMPDPRTDTAALVTLLSVMAERQQSLATVARRFRVPIASDVTNAELAASGRFAAVPAAEVGVIRANRSGGVEVVAGYDTDVGSSLDFPMVAIAADGAPDGELPDGVGRTTQVLREVLLDETTQELFGTAGLRTRDGSLAETWQERSGVLARKVPAGGDYQAELVRSVLDRWASVGRRFRLLVLVDRSGSMAQGLQGSSASKAQLARAALDNLVRRLAPDSEMGLWAFTSGLAGGDTDVVVETGPVAGALGDGTRREALLAAVRTLRPKVGGATPLYDAVLSAFRSAQRDYAYGRLNAVVVVSDGRNQDNRSISLPDLLDTLRLEFDGVRPVRIITIAYGAGADGATLRRISSVTGGRSYRAVTRAEIARVLTRAIADL